MEFATLLTGLGRGVAVIEALDRLLPALDREFGQRVAMNLKRDGAQVFTGARVSRVSRAQDGLCVEFETRGGHASYTADAVLCAVGRRANTGGLFGAHVQVEMERGRIRVDGRFETSVPGIYAVGDVTGGVQLAHAASAQGIACVEGIAGVSSEIGRAHV